MPELPEVEHLRRGLHPLIVGRRIERVEVYHQRTVRRTSADALEQGTVGRSIVDTNRRGKYLLLQLDDGAEVMVHLRMSGQLRVERSDAELLGHTQVIFTLDDDHHLRFVDPRTFGEVVVHRPEVDPPLIPELERLGDDPLVDSLSIERLRPAFSRRRQLKALLLDQTVIAGVGNIYADEALHRARLRPTRLANTLRRTQIVRLLEVIETLLAEAADAGGSTLNDAQYVGADGAAGEFQGRHLVYARAGKRCITCGRGWIRSATVAGRTTCWCPWCQR